MFIDTSVEAEPEPVTGFRGVLAIPTFRRLWLAQLTSQLGESVALVAMPLLVYALTGSAELLGLIFVIQLLPRVVLAPIAGMLADRLDRRRIILTADLSRAALVAILPFCDRTWQVALVAALVAVGNALAKPAELAAVPSVVPPAQLVSAMSITQVASSIVRVIGPATAAGIVGVMGPAPAFGLQSLCFLVSAGCVFGLTLPPVSRAKTTAGLPPMPPSTGGGSLAAAARQEIGEGLRIVRDNPIVRGITAVEALWQAVTAALVVTVLIFVEATLRLGEESGTIFSLATATFAAGTALGAVVARPVERRIGRPWLMGIGYFAPLLFIPPGLVPSQPVLFVSLFILGFTDSWAVIALQTYLAEAVPDALRGRVYATWLGVITLAGAAWFGVVGWITPRLGPPATLAFIGAVVGIGGPILLLATGAAAAMRRGAHTP